MKRALLTAATCLCLTSCASVPRVKRLEARMTSVEQSLAAQGSRVDGLDASLRDTTVRLTTVESGTTSNEGRIGTLEQGVSALLENETVLARRVTALERYISWSGRFVVTIEPDQKWHVLYANSTGESQKVRVRKTQGEGASSIRVGVISRIASEDAGGIATGVTPPSWDMSGVGSQRWLRLGCGQELSVKAEDSSARFEILVSRDLNPVKC